MGLVGVRFLQPDDFIPYPPIEFFSRTSRQVGKSFRISARCLKKAKKSQEKAKKGAKRSQTKPNEARILVVS
jgi:hypothetical protein